MEPERFSTDWKRRLRRRLLAWYDRHARDLPWRRDPELYRVWVSEVMLQQTQVATVVPYFERFVARFPDVQALAEAKESEVLRYWEGLGYYRRARQLHAAAQQVCREFDGQVPRQIDQLRALPGIGRYTAGAILSVALGQRHPVLEANTIRLLSRLALYEGDPRSAAGQRLLWDVAEALLPRKRVGDLNQALMELGASVCTPRNPKCLICPLAALCPTRERGWQDRIPAAKARPAVTDVSEAAVLIRRGESFLLRRCQPGERWAGLWDFPRFVLSDADTSRRAQLLRDATRELTGLTVEPRDQLTVIRHGVTRFRITLFCHLAEYCSGDGGRREQRWVLPGQLGSYPLSVTGRKLSRFCGTT